MNRNRKIDYLEYGFYVLIIAVALIWAALV